MARVTWSIPCLERLLRIRGRRTFPAAPTPRNKDALRCRCLHPAAVDETEDETLAARNTPEADIFLSALTQKRVHSQ